METVKKSAKEVGSEFLKSVSASNIVIHPATKNSEALGIITLNCSVQTDKGESLLSILVEHKNLKTTQPLVTRIGEILVTLRLGEINFAYATINVFSEKDKVVIHYQRDSYTLYEGNEPPVHEIYDIYDDTFRKLATVRNVLISAYEKHPNMLIVK
jgi:hypothetical protein